MKKNKHLRNLIIAVALILVFATVIGAVILIDKLNNKATTEIDIAGAQQIVDDTLKGLPNGVALSAKKIYENTTVKVVDLEYGTEKNIVLHCEYKTIDVKSAVTDNINTLLGIEINDKNGRPKNATKIMLEITGKLNSYLDTASTLEGELDITLYETKETGLVMYLDDQTVNTVFGGILDAKEFVKNTNKINNGVEEIDITNRNSLRSGCIDCFSLVNYSSDKPDTSSAIERFWNDFTDEFYRNFIEDNRWTYLASGLGTTLAITALALVLGIVIGFVVAIIRTTNEKTGKLKIINSICKLYLSIMRGTPVMVQLMIIYFVLLLPLGIEKFAAAVLCFGINSGAYVAEIVRGGIMSVDEGQNEAGRSLGLGYVATMWYIIIPQAIKAILPSLANEFIALLKETSVAFYIGVADLTQGGLKIRSITYSNFMPLIAIALIYLVLVLGLSYLVSLLERRLRKSDRS